MKFSKIGLIIVLSVLGLSLILLPKNITAFTTSSTGYANNGAPEKDAYAGDTNVLIMDISLPDPVSDTTIGGTAPSAGTQITATKDSDWTTMSFYDASAGDAFSSTTDWIGLDDDQDGVSTSAADTEVDCDGSTSTDKGTCDAHNPGDALTATAASDNLCADDLANPTIVFIDSDGNCDTADGTITNLLGSASGSYTAVGTNWAYVDANSSGSYDDGEDLYIENVAGELTYSAAADTTIAGTAPSAGTTITTTEPTDWNLYYHDKTDGDAWDGSNDWIGLDNDQSGYYNGDKITSIVVQNIENALDDDISAIKIWQEDGTTAGFQPTQDTVIGSDTAGLKWGQTISTPSSVVYTATSKDRIYVTVDISSNAVNGRLIQAKIPVNGIQFASTNDGPTDTAIVNPSAQTIVSTSTTTSTDNTPPTSEITDPEDGATITAGEDYLIQGTSSDTGGSSVKQVEISFDGGMTWQTVTPLETSDNGFTWQYLWENPEEGTYNIKTRATDWIGNTETPGEGITVYVKAPQEEEEVTEEQPTEEEEVTEEEKPISEMSLEEIKAKIIEIQRKILEILIQLIQALQEQLS